MRQRAFKNDAAAESARITRRAALIDAAVERRMASTGALCLGQSLCIQNLCGGCSPTPAPGKG